MDVLTAIASRRSIRAFKSTPVPDETLQTILLAATQAPSGKNRQPWRFVVVREDRRAEMVRLLRAGIEEVKAHGIDYGSSENTAAIMEQAPLTVFVFNPDGLGPEESRSLHQVLMDAVDVQSVGAAIQNMCLAAPGACRRTCFDKRGCIPVAAGKAPERRRIEGRCGKRRERSRRTLGAAAARMRFSDRLLTLGLGSLWICDVYYAYERLQSWLDEPGQLVAAVSFGYPDESPAARPRRLVAQVSRTR